MNKATKIKYLTRFLGQSRALVLLGLIHQYPDKAQPERDGWFHADHLKLWQLVKMPKSVYFSALFGLAEERLLSLGERKGQGGGKIERGLVRIEFQAIEECLRFAWLRWTARRMAMYFRKHPLRRLKKRLAATETQAPI